MSEEKDEEETGSQWVRNLIVIPLIVGVAVAIIGSIIAFSIPQMFEKSKELSYTVVIQDQKLDLDKLVVDYLKEKASGLEIKDIHIYQIRLWNSGDIALKEIAVRCEFQSASEEFLVLRTEHKTIPAQEFGSIREEKPGPEVVRFVYELLNSGDQDTITFLTNGPANIVLYAKAEGLSFLEVTSSSETAKSVLEVTQIILIMVVISFMTSWLVGLIFEIGAVFRRRRFEKLAKSISKKIDGIQSKNQ